MMQYPFHCPNPFIEEDNLIGTLLPEHLELMAGL